jgi:hypothetical protein
LKAFNFTGIVIATLHFVLAFLVCLSLPEVRRRGNIAAAILYLILSFATVIWISRSVQWPQ